jgi:hypothetical protein
LSSLADRAAGAWLPDDLSSERPRSFDGVSGRAVASRAETESGGPHIARITTAGVITTYKIPLPASYNATAIARGQGRTLWVTSNALAGLVKVTLPQR